MRGMGRGLVVAMMVAIRGIWTGSVALLGGNSLCSDGRWMRCRRNLTSSRRRRRRRERGRRRRVAMLLLKCRASRRTATTTTNIAVLMLADY